MGMLRLEAAPMRFTGLSTEIPEDLIHDFASDPLSVYDKVLEKSNDHTWPLYPELSQFLAGLPPEAIAASYADNTFLALYGRDERLARVWFTERLLIEEVARRRLKSLAELPGPGRGMPYSADCLRDVRVDGEGMVRLAEFKYNGSTLGTNGFSFTVCPPMRLRIRRTGSCSRSIRRMSPTTSASASIRSFGAPAIPSRR